jgi:predicted Zn-dependent protease
VPVGDGQPTLRVTVAHHRRDGGMSQELLEIADRVVAQAAPASRSRRPGRGANYADAWGEAAVATTTGIRQAGRENGCYVSVSTMASDDGDETQTGFGFSVGRSPDEFDLDKAAREAAERATRLLGATKPTSRRITVVLDPS